MYVHNISGNIHTQKGTHTQILTKFSYTESIFMWFMFFNFTWSSIFYFKMVHSN